MPFGKLKVLTKLLTSSAALRNQAAQPLLAGSEEASADKPSNDAAIPDVGVSSASAGAPSKKSRCSGTTKAAKRVSRNSRSSTSSRTSTSIVSVSATPSTGPKAATPHGSSKKPATGGAARPVRRNRTVRQAAPTAKSSAKVSHTDPAVGASQSSASSHDGAAHSKSAAGKPVTIVRTHVPNKIMGKKEIDPTQLKSMHSVIQNRRAMLKKTGTANTMPEKSSPKVESVLRRSKTTIPSDMTAAGNRASRLRGKAAPKPPCKKKPQDCDPEHQDLADFFGNMIDWSDHESEATTSNLCERTLMKHTAKTRATSRGCGASMLRKTRHSRNSSMSSGSEIAVAQWGQRKNAE